MLVRVPTFPFPEKSVAMVPVASSNDQYPTSPRLFGGRDIEPAETVFGDITKNIITIAVIANISVVYPNTFEDSVWTIPRRLPASGRLWQAGASNPEHCVILAKAGIQCLWYLLRVGRGE